MVRNSLPDTGAVRFAQKYFGLPDNLTAAIAGVATSTVMNHANKGGWSAGDGLPQDDPRRCLDKAERDEDGNWAFVETAAKALVEEPDPLSDDEMIENIRKSWRKILGDTLDLVAEGRLGLVQKRALDRLDGAMKSFEKLVKLTGADLGGAERGVSQLSADELSDMLNKMAGRIDDLAQEQYQNMAGGKFRQAEAG